MSATINEITDIEQGKTHYEHTEHGDHAGPETRHWIRFTFRGRRYSYGRCQFLSCLDRPKGSREYGWRIAQRQTGEWLAWIPNGDGTATEEPATPDEAALGEMAFRQNALQAMIEEPRKVYVPQRTEPYQKGDAGSPEWESE